ncbi:MAG: site-specific integrase, partial [Tepidisphaeraceae bacterium]
PPAPAAARSRSHTRGAVDPCHDDHEEAAMPRTSLTNPERTVRSGRRIPGTGSLLVRRMPDGSERWYGSWYIGGRRVKRQLGPKRRRGERTGLTEAQAEVELRRLIFESEDQQPVSEHLTIAELGARFIKNSERRGRKRASRENHDSNLRVHIVPFLRDRPVHLITPDDIATLIDILERKDLASRTIRGIVGTVSALFNFALAPQRRWVATNPCQGIELPAIPDPVEVRYLTLPEVDRLLAHVRPGDCQQLDHALYMTAVMTGLRQGELIALRWRDVDWNAQRIRVRRNYSRGEFGTPKSRRSSRAVPMIDRLSNELRQVYNRTHRRNPDDLVFAHPATGGVLPKPSVYERMKATLRAAGLDTTHRFHDLRHTFGTHTAAAGVPMRTLQEWMGHRDLTTTQRYADYAPSPHEGRWWRLRSRGRNATVGGPPR